MSWQYAKLLEGSNYTVTARIMRDHNLTLSDDPREIDCGGADGDIEVRFNSVQFLYGSVPLGISVDVVQKDMSDGN